MTVFEADESIDFGRYGLFHGHWSGEGDGHYGVMETGDSSSYGSGRGYGTGYGYGYGDSEAGGEDEYYGDGNGDGSGMEGDEDN
jgi:hypothetical protein